MERRSNTYIFNIKKRPSKYSFLLAIPYYMYRIQTRKFTDGLNFFQRAILKFMAKPGVSAEAIASIMDIDIRLVNLVVKQLKEKKCIDENGLLTKEGLDYRNSSMGIVIDDSEKRIGYIFQMLDKDDYYPFYVNNINVVQSYVDYDNNIGIIFEAEERERDFKSHIFILDIKQNSEIHNPSDLQILQLMENGCKANSFLKEALPLSYRKCDRLKIEFLPDEIPENVFVCTYVYLQSLGNNYFDKEWKVLDPFREDEDSPGLKFYLQSLNNHSFNNQVVECFKNALTQNHASWSDSENEMAIKAEELLSNDFSQVPSIPVDSNDQFNNFTKIVVEYIVKNQASGFNRGDISHMIITYTQRLVELVFTIDSKERHSLYNSIDKAWFTELKTDSYSHQVCRDRNGKPIRRLKNLSGDMRFKNEIMSVLDWYMPKRDDTYYKLKAIAGNFDNKVGLYKNIFILLLCWTNDNDDKLLRMLKPHLPFVLDRCVHRNIGSHGSLQNDTILNEHDNNDYYEFLVTTQSSF